MFGMDEETLKEAGLGSAEEFASNFKAGLDNYEWNVDDALKTAVGKQSEDLEEYDLNSEELTAYAKQLMTVAEESEELDDALETNADASVKVAKAVMRMNDGIDTLADGFKDWSSVLKTSSKTSEEYASAMDGMKDALSDVLGTEEKFISNDFVEDHLKDIEKAAKGDEKAIQRLKNALAQDIILKVSSENDLGAETQQRLVSMVNEVQNMIPNIKVGTEIDMNDEQYADFFKKMQEIVDTAGLTAEQANALFGTMGFEAEFVTESKPVKKTGHGTRTVTEMMDEKEVTMPDGSKMTIPSGWETKTYPGEAYEYVDYVDTIAMSTDGKTPKIKSITRTSSPSMNNYSSKNPGGKSPGSKSGGSTKQSKKEDRLKSEIDRYHTVDTQLQLISNDLDKLQSQRDKLFGKNLIDNLNSELGLLNKQIDVTNQKIAIANEESQELKDKLTAKGVTFGADGTISNYAAAYEAQLAATNAVIDKYNAMSADEQEKFQDTLDQAKEDWNQFVEDMDRYDELQSSFIPDLKKQIREALDRKLEINIEKFDMEIEIRLDLKEARREWNEFKKDIIDGIDEDDFVGDARYQLNNLKDIYYKEDGTGQIQKMSQHLEQVIQQVKNQENQLNSIYSDNQTKALEDLQKYYQQLMEDLRDVDEAEKQIYQDFLDLMDQAQEKFDEQIEIFDTITGLIEHDMDLIKLTRGEDSYAELAKYYDKQQENNNQQLDFLRQQEQFWANALEDAEKGSDEWLSAKEKWIAAVEATNEKINESIQTTQDKYMNMIDLIFQKLNDKVTDGKGLNYVNEEWILLKQNADMYLDSVNAIYNTQQLANKYQKAIDDTDSISMQRKLNNLMKEEIAKLKEKDKLTQYDIDRAELRYQIALKQIALEEAQQNKNTMRLKRDSQGNYRYQFVADNDEVSSIQEEISNLYNQLYNLDYDAYRDNLDQIYSIWEEYQEKMREAAQLRLTDEEAGLALMELYQKEYYEAIEGYLTQNKEIRDGLQESTWMELMDFYRNDEDAFKNNLGSKFEGMEEILDKTQISTNQWLEDIADSFQIMIDQVTGEDEGFMSQLIAGWNSGIQDMTDTLIGDEGFKDTCVNAWDEMDEAINKYREDIEKIQESSGTSFDSIADGLDENIEKTDSLREENEELIRTYEGMFDAMKEVIEQLETLKQKYDEVTQSAKKLAQQGKETWEGIQEKGADAASKDKGTATSSKTDTTLQTNTNTGNGGGAGSGTSTETGGAGKGIPGVISHSDLVKLIYQMGIGSYDNYPGRKTRVEAKYPGAYSTAQSLLNKAWPTIKNQAASKWNSTIESIVTAAGYDTGGYTGEWGKDGKLAVLHQKELVLNAEDTKNLLNAVKILRNTNSALLEKLVNISANGQLAYANGVASDILEQNVHISAEFPNVKDAREVENAIDNLINRAQQHINIKKR